jgi:amino acid transporter
LCTTSKLTKEVVVAQRPDAVKKMRLLPLIAATYFMVSGGPYGLEDIIGKVGYGRAILLLLLIPIFWSLPTSLMVGELASAMPKEGGFYHWVRQAMGPFWGFQEAWLSLAASVFDMAIYPTTFVLYLSHLAPGLTSGHAGLLLKLGIVGISAVWNLRGAVAVGRGSERMMAVSLSPFVLLVGLAVWHAITHRMKVAAVGAPANLDLDGAVLVTLWNYMGWDNASTIAQEVENPQRTYPRAMFTSAVVVACVYLLPLVAVWIAGIPAAQFSTGAWVDAAMVLGGSALAVMVVLAGSLDGLGTFNALTLSLTRLPYAMAEDGLLPRVLTKRWANGVPWVSVIACSLGWALALGFTFERLISIDLVLYGAALILEFVALIVQAFPYPGWNIRRCRYRSWSNSTNSVCSLGCTRREDRRSPCTWIRVDYRRGRAINLLAGPPEISICRKGAAIRNSLGEQTFVATFSEQADARG